MLTSEDHKRLAFFRRLKRAERERLERFQDEETRKRWLLRCGSGGFGRAKGKQPKITLPKLSCLEKKP